MYELIFITKTADKYECPKCGNHDLNIPVWDDDPLNPPQPSPIEDGVCPTVRGGCEFKGFRMDFDLSGKMKAEFEKLLS